MTRDELGMALANAFARSRRFISIHETAVLVLPVCMFLYNSVAYASLVLNGYIIRMSVLRHKGYARDSCCNRSEELSSLDRRGSKAVGCAPVKTLCR